MNVLPAYAETPESQDSGEIVVKIHYKESAALFTRYDARIHLSLLIDDEDLLSQIELLREQSKPELEPLIKQYMYTAETLTQFALKNKNVRDTQQKKEQFMKVFTTTQKRIHTVLAQYKAVIKSIIQRHTLRTLHDKSAFSDQLQFSELSAGRYRVYGALTFATTSLTWFEPIHVKGGGRYTVTLTRENMMNPDWTELNWWSFMNLDFSKHH